MINHEILIAKGFKSYEDEEDNAIYEKGEAGSGEFTYIIAYMDDNWERYFLHHNGNFFEITSIDDMESKR